MVVNDGNTVSVDYWRTYLYFLVSRVLRCSLLKRLYHLCYSNTLKSQNLRGTFTCSANLA